MQRTQRVYKRWVAFVGLMLCLLLWLPAAGAQPQGGKSYAFRGTVEKVDANAQTLSVSKVEGKAKTATGVSSEGWMMTMTQTYRVDKPEVLSRVKAGDQITARCPTVTCRRCTTCRSCPLPRAQATACSAD